MFKTVIVVEGGIVTAVYSSAPHGDTDIEILDMDTTDMDELSLLEDRLTSVQQYLTKQY